MKTMGGGVNTGYSSTEDEGMLSDFKQKLTVHETAAPEGSDCAPIISSYNDKIRPLLDAVDRLRNMKILQEDIQLPTIVVIGDQSSGKSSVLESLSGISLPRGEGICTRVPLVMRLQSHPTLEPDLTLEFNGKVVPTGETDVANAIVRATEELAGKEKGVSNSPLTLIVKKMGIPNLTMVDLPGIATVPVHGQPEDIYEQISSINMKFMKPEESIILNVLSASVDFITCESIRMSQQVDKTGQRTLFVITKADKAPEGLLEKITADDTSLSLGYVCVRNRIGNESYEEARAEEAKLFQKHPLLLRISKSMVGIPVLAEKLMQIQITLITKCFPEIVTRISNKLSVNMEDLNKLPQNLASLPEAVTVFMHILGSAKESLSKILLRREFDEYPDANEMHCTARLAEMFDKFFNKMDASSADNCIKTKFLEEEIKVLIETRHVGQKHFLLRAALLTLLQKKVKVISVILLDFVETAWSYLEIVVVSVLMKHCNNYPQLKSCTRPAVKNLVAKMKKKSKEWVDDVVEMEMLADYTCSRQYEKDLNKLMSFEKHFMDVVNHSYYFTTKVNIEGLGLIDVAHLRGGVANVKEAFDLKMRMSAYWKVVLVRLVDQIALHFLLSVQNLVNKEMETVIISEVMGPQCSGLQRLLGDAPGVAEERLRLETSIKLLQDSKDVLAKIMGKNNF